MFLFSKGTWLGQGSLKYTHAKEKLLFNTRWEIDELSPGIFQAQHKVEIEGVEECHTNVYTFFPIDDKTFRLVLQNPIVEQVEGKGFIEEGKIGWNIDTPVLKGYETFTKLDEKTYTLEGEYFSQDLSSKIEGKLWKKFVGGSHG